MRSIAPVILSLALSACTLVKPPKLIKSEEGKISFCVVGDVGDGSSDQMNVAEAMRASGCEELILLGDLIYEKGIKSPEDSVLRKRFFEPYRKFRKIYLVLGNHDYRGNVEAWMELSSKDKRIIHPAPYFMEKKGKSCLFFLDTNFHADDEMFEKESQWLSMAPKDCSYKVAFTHHPYLSSGKRHGPAIRHVKEFFEESIVGKFAFIFSGHEHIIADEGVAEGTRQIISGAGGKHDQGESPGFAIFTLDIESPEKSTYSLIRI